jgi:spore coat polysaccharide biosynthesis protein SpsF
MRDKTVAIIQARMNSSRLPGKVLMPLAGKPVLYRVIERLRHCRLLDEIVVATSNNDSDEPVSDFCKSQDINCFRGSLDDVLGRYYFAATEYNAEIIIRITADCPVIDPVVVDAVVTASLSGEFDCIGLSGDFPDGLDCTAIRFKALETAYNQAKLKSEREHVVPFISSNEEKFKLGKVELFWKLSNERWTLDEQNDYLLLSKIYDELYKKNKIFLTNDILRFLEKNKDIKNINKDIVRNEGYLKSLSEDD